jgi:taurine dioxygenase
MALAPAEDRSSAESRQRLLGGHVGVEFEGVDLRTIDDDQLAALRAAVVDRCVAVVRGQHLDAADLVAFGRRLGPLNEFADVERVDQAPEVVPIRGSVSITEVWHSDGTFREVPPAFSVLAAQTLPPAGGDTMFANQYAALEGLSPAYRRMISTLRALHTAVYDDEPQVVSEQPPRAQPVVRTHPESGRPALFVNPLFTRSFEGMSEAESAPILDHLFRHMVEPEYVYRHRWVDGDVVIWDNRCTLHYVVQDFGEGPRLLYRVQTTDGLLPV